SNADMSDIILESESSENSLLIEAGVLNNDQTYFWNVTALDADGEVLSDPVELAEFATPSQSAISLISPLETGLKSLQPTFQWNVFSGAATYNLMISSDNEFTAIIIDINSDKNSYNSNKESGCEYGSSYFWKVKALDEEGNLLSESSTGEFSFADLPAITLKSPDNDASISDVFPVFTWEGLEDAAAFNFQISQNADMSESRIYTVASNTFTYRDDDFPLEKNKVYHWLVYAINSDGGIFSKNSETRSFKREEQLALNLEKPGNSEKVTNKQPHFRWTAIEGAENYEIILASDESFSDIKWNIDNITENNVLYPSQGVDDLLADTKYFWKVRAYGKDQLLTDYSSSFNFELLLDLTPIANSPVGITAEDLNPTFTWSTIKGADHYEIHIGLDAEMSQVFFSETKIMQSRYKYPDTGVPPLPYDQQLYWYIVAVDEAGNTLGDPSAVVSFKTLTGIIELELVFSN
ncbi:MAG: hypothetical protein KAI81_01475, partial [Candidatus Marinimicrobia bacterium]|nr:hypothetical protein [Candidatus Neomarinimicrobiota bacterium]